MTAKLSSDRFANPSHGSGDGGPTLDSARQWLDSPHPLSLPPHEVHVWRISVDNMVDRLPWFVQVLGAEERVRVARYRHEADRNCRIVARGVLRSLLAAYREKSADAITISYGRHGKPMLDHKGSKKPIEFNVSHSRSIVLLAFSVYAAVGIDVEAMRTDIDLSGPAARILAPEEIAVFEGAAERVKTELFYRAWTRKEAVLKAVGTGFLVEPDQVVVLADSSSTSVACVCYPSAGSPRFVQVTDLPVGQEYCAAVAFDQADLKLRLFSDFSAA